MSKTLSLPEHLLSQGRNYVNHGRDQEALVVFTRLVRLGSLTPNVAEEAHLQLANIHLRREDYQQARRHLHVLLVRDPKKSEYHYLMALTLDASEDGDPDRACHHYERAIELDGDEPTYWHDFGDCLLRCGATEEGLQALERSVELDPDEIDFLLDLVRSLGQVGEFARARKAVLHAMFRNPDDDRLRRAWDDVRFREVLWEQRRKLQRQTPASAAAPNILPYPKKAAANGKAMAITSDEGQVIRLDPAAAAKPPHAPKGKHYRQSN